MEILVRNPARVGRSWIKKVVLTWALRKKDQILHRFRHCIHLWTWWILSESRSSSSQVYLYSCKHANLKKDIWVQSFIWIIIVGVKQNFNISLLNHLHHLWNWASRLALIINYIKVLSNNLVLIISTASQGYQHLRTTLLIVNLGVGEPFFTVIIMLWIPWIFLVAVQWEDMLGECLFWDRPTARTRMNLFTGPGNLEHRIISVTLSDWLVQSQPLAPKKTYPSPLIVFLNPQHHPMYFAISYAPPQHTHTRILVCDLRDNESYWKIKEMRGGFRGLWFYVHGG